MKNIKELGLELIELEDQVLLGIEKQTLLIDPNEPPQEGDWIYWNRMIVKDTLYSKDTKFIVASTKPLEGLPLLVIEDYVNIPEFELELEKLRFQQGYDKTRQIFKFTEEDLRKAISMTRETLEWDEKWGWFTTKTEDEIIESISKKELYVEVECSGRNCIEDYGCTKDVCNNVKSDIPKIVNNQIKAVWK